LSVVFSLVRGLSTEGSGNSPAGAGCEGRDLYPNGGHRHLSGMEHEVQVLNLFITFVAPEFYTIKYSFCTIHSKNRLNIYCTMCLGFGPTTKAECIYWKTQVERV